MNRYLLSADTRKELRKVIKEQQQALPAIIETFEHSVRKHALDELDGFLDWLESA